ncbi:MAG: fructose-bisphosphate aldolase class I [Legionellales bacterium]|nr:fructose-bisphosphate aldolase class I [Legionellales bacterium]
MSSIIETAKAIGTRGKGILAADESTGTIAKRFSDISLESTEDNRRAYREMLFTANGIKEYLSGVILFEETLMQKSSSGKLLADILTELNIIPGIKVDKGLVNLPFTDHEKITQGLDGLAERLEEYKKYGAKFAKWRAVFNISDIKPTQLAIEANAHALARYAAICQSAGIAPIVEPEILMDGNHTIARCKAVTEQVLQTVFAQLHLHKVKLEGIILKPSMVTTGQSASQQADIEQVAKDTIEVLLRTVPAAVPTINFLSGGQSAELATAHLNMMNKLYPNLPWTLSFSYGRALQAPCLDAWHGQAENVEKAQTILHKRCKLNGLAVTGDYASEMEA